MLAICYFRGTIKKYAQSGKVLQIKENFHCFLLLYYQVKSPLKGCDET